jgi:peptidylprolyl isomerase
VKTTEISPLIQGSGAPIQPQQEIIADITILNGTTGAVVTKTEYTRVSTANAFVIDKVPVRGLVKALACAKVGERLAAVIPPKEGLSADRRGTAIAATDSIVVVADVRRAYLARANGRDQVMAGGLPAVVLGADGRPGITLPEGNPPKKLQVADLKKGSGALIARGDTAIVQYTGVIWKPGDPGNGTVFDSSWTTGSPVAFPVKSGSLIKGFVTALAGQRVGSQVLAVIPPSQAYGSAGSTSVPAGATLVFVVDVLGKG